MCFIAFTSSIVQFLFRSVTSDELKVVLAIRELGVYFLMLDNLALLTLLLYGSSLLLLNLLVNNNNTQDLCQVILWGSRLDIEPLESIRADNQVCDKHTLLIANGLGTDMVTSWSLVPALSRAVNLCTAIVRAGLTSCRVHVSVNHLVEDVASDDGCHHSCTGMSMRRRG